MVKRSFKYANCAPCRGSDATTIGGASVVNDHAKSLSARRINQLRASRVTVTLTVVLRGHVSAGVNVALLPRQFHAPRMLGVI